MILSLVALVAIGQAVEPDSALEGTWELVALSASGLARPGEGKLLIEPPSKGKDARWTWDAIHMMRGPYFARRQAGSPWPKIVADFDEGPIGGHVRPREGVYKLAGETLTLAFEDRRQGGAAQPDDPFQPGIHRTVETYRRVAKTADPKFRPRPFPTKPGKVAAKWDEALRGGLQNPPRGILNHMQLRDYGDGIMIAVRAGSEFLDDPPAPDLDDKDAPTGTLVKPPGGRFDAKQDRVIDPAPTAEQKAIIDTFREQNPDNPDRHVIFGHLDPQKPFVPGTKLLGWDGVLARVEKKGDRSIATVVFLPRVIGKGTYGRALLHYSPPLIETWEYRDGKLRYLAGGPDLTNVGNGNRWPFVPQSDAR